MGNQKQSRDEVPIIEWVHFENDSKWWFWGLRKKHGPYGTEREAIDASNTLFESLLRIG